MKFKLTALILLAVVVFGFYSYKKFVTPFTRGDSSPLFVLKDLQGANVNLLDFRGRRVLIHFWATWCPNCVAEFPNLEIFAQSHPEITVLAISEDDLGAEALLNFFGDKKISITVLLDEKGRVADLYKSYMVPQTFLLDESGRFVDFFLGAQNWLDPKLVQKIKEKQAGTH